MIFEVFWWFGILDGPFKTIRGVSSVKMVVWVVWVMAKCGGFDRFFAIFLDFWSKKTSFVGFLVGLERQFCVEKFNE